MIDPHITLTHLEALVRVVDGTMIVARIDGRWRVTLHGGSAYARVEGSTLLDAFAALIDKVAENEAIET